MADPAQTETSTNLGPWIVSLIALAQVWVIALLKKLRRPRLALYETGTLEVGYATLGPTLGKMGTLNTSHKDAFIRGIRITVTKKKDSSSHVFQWRAFRSSVIAFKPGDEPPMEVAASFLLQQTNPFKYNILFVDDAFLAEVTPKVSNLAVKWNEYRNAKLKELQQKYQKDISELAQIPMLNETMHQDFSSKGTVTPEWDVLNRSCYWDAGDYELAVCVETDQMRKPYTVRFSFALTPDDEKMLRLNAVGVVRSICGLETQWYFAQPKYKRL